MSRERRQQLHRDGAVRAGAAVWAGAGTARRVAVSHAKQVNGCRDRHRLDVEVSGAAGGRQEPLEPQRQVLTVCRQTQTSAGNKPTEV